MLLMIIPTQAYAEPAAHQQSACPRESPRRCHFIFTITPVWARITENKMPRSDVESTNLHMLNVIRLSIEADRIGACARFALSAPLAERLRSLTQEQLWAFVVHIGQTTLFPPRQNLLALLDAPRPLVGTLAAAQTPRPDPPREVVNPGASAD